MTTASSLPHESDIRIAVVGLGYVGLPLAVALAEHYRVTAFDIDARRVAHLEDGRDSICGLDSAALARPTLTFTASPAELDAANVYIVAVPTPVDAHRRPDLQHLEKACTTLGNVLEPGNLVIFEATVYPGCTEEFCAPILEQRSGLHCIRSGAEDAVAGFHLGYSPERINPGDEAHSLRNVIKVTAGASKQAAEFVDRLYTRIVDAGTHPVSTIRVAEAAKVIENTQRDLNIALVNELALIFNRLGIPTREVLEAAGSKWNFLPFKPGLVGGHCIGVDPYYLTHKAEEIGYHPEVILAGRRINDGMGDYVAQETIRLFALRGKPLKRARCLVLGLTFKENCGDTRNTRVVDIVTGLERYGVEVDVHDPWVAAKDARVILGRNLIERPEERTYDAIVLAVAHSTFCDLGLKRIRAFGKEDAVLYDVKGLFDPGSVDGQL